MAEQATKLVEHNGLSEVVKVMQSRAEELKLPDKVDLIVSEWMGTLLLVRIIYSLLSRPSSTRFYLAALEENWGVHFISQT